MVLLLKMVRRRRRRREDHDGLFVMVIWQLCVYA
jgi:hypothetical protein